MVRRRSVYIYVMLPPHAMLIIDYALLLESLVTPSRWIHLPVYILMYQASIPSSFDNLSISCLYSAYFLKVLVFYIQLLTRILPIKLIKP